METRPGFLVGRACRLDLRLPQIMGVLNVTPDSFSDGGCYLGIEAALQQARRMISEGASLLDIGGESTRPGAAAVSEQQELDRVLPLIEQLRKENDIPLSIDTSKSAVAAAAVAAGANFINDISGLQFDPAMAQTAATTDAGLFLMHTRGRPAQMQQSTQYADLNAEVHDFLLRAAAQAQDAGVARKAICVDPGIGFGKDALGNLQLLRRIDTLVETGYPVLLGTSRKSFIGQVLQLAEPLERLSGTLASVALGVARGVQIFRVHDVRPAREAALLAWAVREGELPAIDD